jgi:ADP-ribosylation factor GTPase-activating protein 1
MERAQDPNLHSSLSAYYATASSTLASSARAGGSILASGLSDGSNLLREKGFNVGDLGSSYLERATGRGAGEGYGRVGEVEAPREGGEREEEDFFGAYDNGNKSSAGGLAKEREGIWKDERPTPVSNAGRVEEPTPTLSIPDYGGEDAWAKLSPASSARREPSPGLGAKKVTAVKKEIKKDDWDDFGTDDWKN